MNKHLQDIIVKCCSLHTTFCPEAWNELNPTLGNCGNAAILINKVKGFSIWKAYVYDMKDRLITPCHYFNWGVDYTKIQFNEPVQVEKNTPVTVEDILCNEWFIERHNLFMSNYLAL